MQSRMCVAPVSLDLACVMAVVDTCPGGIHSAEQQGPTSSIDARRALAGTHMHADVGTHKRSAAAVQESSAGCMAAGRPEQGGAGGKVAGEQRSAPKGVEATRIACDAEARHSTPAQPARFRRAAPAPPASLDLQLIHIEQ